MIELVELFQRSNSLLKSKNTACGKFLAGQSSNISRIRGPYYTAQRLYKCHYDLNTLEKDVFAGLLDVMGPSNRMLTHMSRVLV